MPPDGKRQGEASPEGSFPARNRENVGRPVVARRDAAAPLTRRMRPTPPRQNRRLQHLPSAATQKRFRSRRRQAANRPRFQEDQDSERGAIGLLICATKQEQQTARESAVRARSSLPLALPCSRVGS